MNRSRWNCSIKEVPPYAGRGLLHQGIKSAGGLCNIRRNQRSDNRGRADIQSSSFTDEKAKTKIQIRKTAKLMA